MTQEQKIEWKGMRLVDDQMLSLVVKRDRRIAEKMVKLFVSESFVLESVESVSIPDAPLKRGLLVKGMDKGTHIAVAICRIDFDDRRDQKSSNSLGSYMWQKEGGPSSCVRVDLVECESVGEEEPPLMSFRIRGGTIGGPIQYLGRHIFVNLRAKGEEADELLSLIQDLRETDPDRIGDPMVREAFRKTKCEEGYEEDKALWKEYQWAWRRELEKEMMEAGFSEEEIRSLLGENPSYEL